MTLATVSIKSFHSNRSIQAISRRFTWNGRVEFNNECWHLKWPHKWLLFKWQKWLECNLMDVFVRCNEQTRWLHIAQSWRAIASKTLVFQSIVCLTEVNREIQVTLFTLRLYPALNIVVCFHLNYTQPYTKLKTTLSCNENAIFRMRSEIANDCNKAQRTRPLSKCNAACKRIPHFSEWIYIFFHFYEQWPGKYVSWIITYYAIWYLVILQNMMNSPYDENTKMVTFEWPQSK